MQTISILAALVAFAATATPSLAQAPASPEGGNCGGFAGIPCNLGLECHLNSTIPDAFGSCVAIPQGQPGARCGGKIGKPCDLGLRCKLDKGDQTDKQGVCVEIPRGTLGAKCGGFVGLPCNRGLKCATPAGTADAFGTCIKATN
ncbi:Aste57867_24777 [Aphanomyces stellatus]|uniref:Aste57867_24777 protein n=1 Tax=Aphanomyces stellatus TaxID=120398 RepID=A0A485LRB3_9STRA|nr:hypothetical protein As57867_024699 [Aphanomyces stellatus]VFU01412.1 Aste57867_24777 [Aphanomyces stellatus]